MTLLFVGYELPSDLDLKYDVVFPLLDQHFERIEDQGDQLHIIPNDQMEFAQKLLKDFNIKHCSNLVFELIPYTNHKN